ncbi:MAG: ORF6N domain-containing protein [Bacteroidales bacterium]|nr:ORF6N domain-containing protein [Bacteroidales bacterium]
MQGYSMIATADNIKDLIYTIRGMKVMLDADLAEIYGYSTKAFNQQVKNNLAKFDDDFRFQLTKEEYKEVLRLKFLTSKCLVNASFSDRNDDTGVLRSKNLTLELKQGRFSKYLPYVFTEQGVYMLMTVLKGDLATQQSKALVRAFKEMKNFIIDNRSLVGNRELLQLSIQTTQNTADIAEIKNNMVTKADLAKVIQDFTDPQTRREYLILNGESVEANIAFGTIYKSAKKTIYVVDNYIGLKTLVLLKNANPSVTITVFSDNIGRGLHQSDYDDFHAQYPQHTVTFQKTCGIYHDRYIVIDYKRKTEKIFHCGASSKDAGDKVTTITKVADCQIYHQLIDVLLNNPLLQLK